MCKWRHFGTGQGDSSKKWAPCQSESKITSETHQWLIEASLELANTGVHESTVIKQAESSWLDTTKEAAGVEEGAPNHHANIILTISMEEETSWCGPAWARPAGNH